MSEKKELLTTNRKALTINLDERKYGTFAEIGAGQEVARVFFQAGGASGTVAKTISAYDMNFSDAIYGKAPRYVSRERLGLMLDHEYDLLIERLGETRGDRTTFFVFADTVATKGYKGTNDAHGWLGVRFQTEPGGAPSDVLLHVRMWDKENVLQQEALGIAGTNLIYAAFYYRADPTRFIESLVDNLGAQRLEVDMLKFSGPAFAQIDNRIMALYLVQFGLTNAVMFGPQGEVLQPSEALYKKAILVERGSFRPVTHVNVDMLNCATAQFVQEPAAKGKDIMMIMEITMNNLLAAGALDAQDFLQRVDLLGELGFTAMISNYSEYYRLTSYFRRYTKEMIGMAMGINNLIEIFNEKYYEHLEGGILESFGRMFRHAVKLYIYPMRQEAYDRYLSTGVAVAPGSPVGHAFASSVLITAKNVHVADHLRNLYDHLLENHYIDCIVGFDRDVLGIFSRDVLARIRDHDPSWETMVPIGVAAAIKKRRLFGYNEPAPIPGNRLRREMTLSPLAPALWELNAPLSVMGMHLGHRMTVARLPDRTIWIHSPVQHSATLDAELAALGRVAHIVAPSIMHDTYLEGWFAAYPQARFHAAPEFEKYRRDLKFTDTLSDTPDPAWANSIDQHVVRGMPRINEVAFLHRASHTLILTDLVFNLGPDMPFLSRVLLKLNDCYCKFGPSRMLKSSIKDRAALRSSIDCILKWDFDAIVVSHGANIPRDGKPMLQQAFAFL